MIRITQIKLRPEEGEDLLLSKICKKLKISEKDIESWQITKKSIDARKKEAPVFVYQVDVKTKKQEELFFKHGKGPEIRRVTEARYQFPKDARRTMQHRPVIVGTGPAGLFCGYMLSQAGYGPVLLERGGPVEEREEAVEQFWKTGVLNPECNVQFGEGGAGTFSDGKLNTLIKDPFLRGKKVLELFVSMGAGSEILYDSKPHIGTDVLKQVLKNMRQKIESMGGQFHFHTKATNLEITDGKVSGVYIQDTKAGGITRFIAADVLVLATGHSARDTFQMLYEKRLNMHAKAFAVGLRIEHPQSMIQISQYGEKYGALLPPAPYKVTARASDGRGVYSFCMCPGGYVVNASSEQGMTAVNGMSNHARDGRNSNSAIVVTVSPEDFEDGLSANINPLAGMEFQRRLERNAWRLGNGAVPIQLYGDFKENRKSSGPGEVLPDTKGQNCYTNLRGILPEPLNRAIIEGVDFWGRKILGFDRYDAILSGVESRTSSPVRIERNDQMESSIAGIYPCGEGAGYAGGITSAAVDGIRVAEAIISIK
ncbi:MAG: FAD-dependent oxidoreductase [Lachnospiraceae bacterium]|nr:FAD-dependent oxidoreductase [Lachnospiraceae bacterium]